MTTYWHGGPTIFGDRILPPSVTGNGRITGDEPWVYLTPDRHLAETYASTTGDPWVFEVQPVGDVDLDPDSILAPGTSLRCREAVIVRRFRVSKRDAARLSDTVRSILGGAL